MVYARSAARVEIRHSKFVGCRDAIICCDTAKLIVEGCSFSAISGISVIGAGRGLYSGGVLKFIGDSMKQAYRALLGLEREEPKVVIRRVTIRLSTAERAIGIVSESALIEDCVVSGCERGIESAFGSLSLSLSELRPFCFRKGFWTNQGFFRPSSRSLLAASAARLDQRKRDQQ